MTGGKVKTIIDTLLEMMHELFSYVEIEDEMKLVLRTLRIPILLLKLSLKVNMHKLKYKMSLG